MPIILHSRYTHFNNGPEKKKITIPTSIYQSSPTIPTSQCKETISISANEKYVGPENTWDRREEYTKKFVKAAPPAPAHGYYPQSPLPDPRIGSLGHRMLRGGPGVGFRRRRLRFRVRVRSRSSLVAVDVVRRMIQKLGGRD